MRKPLNRRTRTTPYSRPQSNIPQTPVTAGAGGGGGGWLSKLVTPARRIISGGAALILPSLFMGSPSVEFPISSDDEDHDTLQNEDEQPGEDENERESSEAAFSLSHQIPTAKTVEYGSTSSVGLNGPKEDEGRDLPKNDGLDEIEKLIKGKMFTRDEVDHLMGILNSKNIHSADVAGQKNRPTMLGEVQGLAMTPAFPIKSKEKQECLDRATWEVPTPLPKSNLQDEIGASPIDIARAYMGSRKPETGSSSMSKVLEDDKTLVHMGGYLSIPTIPSPPRKSSTRWPGATVPEQFLTPQTQRGRYEFNNFRQSPYARSVHTMSKSKMTQLRDDGYKSLNIASTPLEQPPTNISVQVKSRTDVLGGQYSSGGPIRRARHQFATGSSRKFVNFSPFPSPLQREKTDVGVYPSPAFRKNVATGGTITSKPQTVEDRLQNELRVSSVPAHSSQTAMKILEHLDKTFPTPKDKSAEIKLAMSWKKPASSNVISIGDTPDSQVGPDKSNQGAAHLDVDGVPSLFGVPARSDTGATADTVKGKSSTFDASFSHPTPRNVNPVNTHENVPNFRFALSNSQAQNLPKKPPTSIPKAALPAISVEKPPLRPSFSSDNRSGFTFPVSAPPMMFPEPPTPSLMPPPSLVNSHPPSKDDSAVPPFSFGSKRSSPSLVFSFPSSSSGVVLDEPSDLKFTFGSDKGRIDFGSIGKDAVCC